MKISSEGQVHYRTKLNNKVLFLMKWYLVVNAMYLNYNIRLFICKNIDKKISEWAVFIIFPLFTILKKTRLNDLWNRRHTCIPRGLTARIAGFHPAGPGSTPGVGTNLFTIHYISPLLIHGILLAYKFQVLRVW